ncbi:MAG: beta-lactamase family protein [Sphingobacteriales bacterium]|nr:beta-lactamase family protein [Sphingobacteriales bacterium]OJV98499.1 MAG: hypothetical protein BGO52_11990 [Sphingobacteriales bacterium 44-61]
MKRINKINYTALLRCGMLLITALVSVITLNSFRNAGTGNQNPPQQIPAVDQQVNSFMNKYNVPGLSIAITKDNRLVYARSYGWADKENNEPATNQSLYRLASLSKQITSAVIMKLIEEGKLNMKDKVFGPGAILGHDFGTFPYKANIKEITINELLHHTCGGWSNDGSKYPDPMFSNPGLHVDELIGWTLDHIPLDNPPGTHYAYSNFGYCVLGRVIEKVTGLPYEKAAKQLILHPCGITDMQIGGNGLQHRRPNEVRYYGQNGEDPYNMNISRLDSHGGWIATATDLARFMCHMNGSPDDILSSSSIQLMNTGSPANPKYACGWTINGPNTWHTGSLPGTQTEQAIIKQKGNFTFVILTNTRTNEVGFQRDMDRIFWNALNQDPEWPDVDLFNTKE